MGLGNDTNSMDMAETSPSGAGSAGAGNGLSVVSSRARSAVRADVAVDRSVDTVDPMLAMIERAARDPAIDIEKFERLMVMKERVDAQRAARAFNAAVADAKGLIPPVLKNKRVDFTSQKGRTNYRHEDFAEVARVVDPVLASHGLSYRYRSKQSTGRLTVTCILSHSMGHFEEATLEVAEDHTGNKNAIQAIGSAATYLQRYTLKLALGLASSADDDGKASAAEPAVEAKKIAELVAMIAETAADPAWICERYSVETLDDLNAKQIAEALSGLAARKRKQQQDAAKGGVK